jgi:hypothetical protein
MRHRRADPEFLCARGLEDRCGFGSFALAVVLTPVARRAASPQLRIVGSIGAGDWRADAPLVRRKIIVDDLPKPFATRSTDNPPGIVARPAAASPKVPPGFEAELFASDHIAASRDRAVIRPVSLDFRQPVL